MLTQDHKIDIAEFLKNMSEKYGILPKFAHNLVAKDSKKVYYSGPYFDNSELAAAIESLLFGKWASSGETCARFEKEFGKAINNKYSFFCNSGSSANLLLIAACKEYYNWQDEDEIIVSAVGFPTTTSAIVHNNLKPVFVDIEWTTLNFDLKKIQAKITDKTKAIFLSPVLGNPPDMDELLKIVEKNNIKLILDNCDSLGSKWKGKYLNEYAEASSCSFYPAHEITTLEGGMVSSNIEEIVKIARSFGTWGRDCFPAGTWINCGEDHKQIQDVQIGDTVISHTGAKRVVENVFSRPYTGDMITLQFRLTDRVKTTFNHPFYVERDGTYQWIEAGNLVTTDLLLEATGKKTGKKMPLISRTNRVFSSLSKDGKYARYLIRSIARKKVTNKKVYNLTVAEDNSYHANNVAVHNCHCVGAANLLCNGTCNKRFSNWIPEFPELIIDHKYVFNRIGWNLKPLDLQAAIGLEQLKKLHSICAWRQANKLVIEKVFVTSIVDITTPFQYNEADWVPFGVPIICKDKDQKQKIVAFLEKNGIQTRHYFAGNLLMHQGYRHLGNYLDYPESNKVLDLVFFVGCAPTISSENIDHIKNVLSAWTN